MTGKRPGRRSMLDYPLELLARVLYARLHGSGAATVRRVSTDSRQVEPGDLFFALSGERFDGHEFVPQVLEKGAAGAVVARGRASAFEKGSALLEVDDPLLA